MMTAVLALALLSAVVVTRQLARVFGVARGVGLGGLLIAVLGGSWLFGHLAPITVAPANWPNVASAPSASCAKCHANHYESWHRSYHRTMTRDATPKYVKGDFDDVTYAYQGLKTRLTREGDGFFMETIDPAWALLRAQANGESAGLPPVRSTKFSVDRLVGSHWVQEYMHREPNGRFSRLPVLFHIVENRWVHSNGAFLAPDSDDFWAQCRGDAWNDTCLYCHNTGPAKNPQRGLRGEVIGYRTEVAELGISCEACHGPGGEHVRLNQNPIRRLALRESGTGDPSIVHPERLSVPRRDEICAYCHGAIVPKPGAWNATSHRDPFVAGQDLGRFNHFFRSEAEQAERQGRQPDPAHHDGRFWGDGTPMTTALEFNGMALSACYQNGKGDLSCLSCHTMHGEDPNFMLKPGMLTNEACYQCHDGYRSRLAEHTRHAADSAGSLCYNCHMPHQVYSLLTTHRSHRIEIPAVAASAGTGKPHACNLCHLDKSLGWTQTQLGRWSDRQQKAVRKLSADEESVSSALLLLTRADARSRVIVAGAFSNPAAQRASGTDWFGPFLTRILDHERYPAVRYLAHRGLRSAHGEAGASPFDYLGRPADRAAQLRALRARFDATPLDRPLPYLPLSPQKRPDDEAIRRLLKQRTDPDLTINE